MYQDRAKQLMSKAQLKFAKQENVYDLNDVQDLVHSNTNYFGDDRNKLAPAIVMPTGQFVIFVDVSNLWVSKNDMFDGHDWNSITIKQKKTPVASISSNTSNTLGTRLKDGPKLTLGTMLKEDNRHPLGTMLIEDDRQIKASSDDFEMTIIEDEKDVETVDGMITGLSEGIKETCIICTNEVGNYAQQLNSISDYILVSGTKSTSGIPLVKEQYYATKSKTIKNEDEMRITDGNQKDTTIAPSTFKSSNEDQLASSILSSTSSIVEQGMKLGKNLKKKTRKLFTGKYSRGMEKVIKDELCNISSMHYHQDLDEIERKQNEDINKSVTNFSKCFGIKKKNSPKKDHLNKVEDTNKNEEADSIKEKKDKALSNSVMMSAAAPDKIREQAKSHIEHEAHPLQHDDIEIFKDVVNCMQTPAFTRNNTSIGNLFGVIIDAVSTWSSTCKDIIVILQILVPTSNNNNNSTSVPPSMNTSTVLSNCTNCYCTSFDSTGTTGNCVNVIDTYLSSDELLHESIHTIVIADKFFLKNETGTKSYQYLMNIFCVDTIIHKGFRGRVLSGVLDLFRHNDELSGKSIMWCIEYTSCKYCWGELVTTNHSMLMEDTIHILLGCRHNWTTAVFWWDYV